MSAIPATRYDALTAPRKDGLTKVTSGSSVQAQTVIRFVATKDELKAVAGAGLAAEDASNDSAVVSYGKNGSGEARFITVSLGATNAGGKVKPATIAGLRKAVGAAVAKAKALKVKGVVEVEAVPAIEGSSVAQAADAITQAAVASNYAFNRYINSADKAPHVIEAFHITHSAGAEVDAAVTVAKALADGHVLARDCGSERADEMHPGRLEAVARSIAEETGMKAFVCAGDELLKEGMHMHYSVGQSATADRAPRYIELLHQGDPEHPEDVIAVVGKAITFDTGGLNLKGTGFMEEMHMDKQGGSNVLGIALAAGRLNVKRNVVFVVAAAENAIDAASYKPHCVMRAKNGKTVTCSNTDAEGRLVLGDSLVMVQERHHPRQIIDMATLTGACVIALGEYAAGGFTNSKALLEGVKAAGEARGERIWHMPILPEHTAELTSCPIADLKSTGNGRYGGACTAAAFLQLFIGDGKEYKPSWLHLDIAGPGMSKGIGTGFGTFAVLEYLRTAAPGAPAVDSE